jgi:hypothetical protein
MNPTIRESCVRAGNTGFTFTLTFILFVLCGTVNLLNAWEAYVAPRDSVAELMNAVNELKIRIENLESRLAHNSALSHDLALVVEYSMEDSDHTQDQDTFAVELLYAF